MKKKYLFIITGDMFLTVLALNFAFWVRFGKIPQFRDLPPNEVVRGLLFILVLLFSSFLLEIYSTNMELKDKELAIRIFLSITVSFFIITGIFYISDVNLYGRGILVISLVMFGVFQYVWHLVYRFGANLPGFISKVVVLGTGPLARQIGNLITSTNHSHILAGYVNCASEPVMVPYHLIIDAEDGLSEAMRRVGADRIVVSLSERRGVFPLQDVLSCKLRGVEVFEAPAFYEQLTGKLLLENITPSWFIFSHGFRVTLNLRMFKRLLDMVCASLGLILTLPLFPIIALIIRIDSSGPIFFRQNRVGEGERIFPLLKFRSMRQDAEKSTGAVWATEKDPRVTRVGEFLRKSRIDEIPQLINVLQGDMSLVGPRPERPEFVKKLKEVIPYYSERHYIKPGVTGWAQVRYPYGASVEDAIEKLRYDLYYIKNISLPFDILIILETVKVVLFRRGGR